MSIEQLTQEALSLPHDLRLQLVEKLLASLEFDVDEATQSEWLTEAQRRRNEIRNGLVQPISGEEALVQARKLLSESSLYFKTSTIIIFSSSICKINYKAG